MKEKLESGREQEKSHDQINPNNTASGLNKKENGAVTASIEPHDSSSQPIAELANSPGDSQNTKTAAVQRTHPDATSMQQQPKPKITTQYALATVQDQAKETQQKRRNILKVFFHRL